MENKPTLSQLRELYSVNVHRLAQVARVSSDTIYLALRGRPIQLVEAENILMGLSSLTGQRHTLRDVHMHLLSEDAG